MQRNMNHYLFLYLGCNTDRGKLIGIKEDRVITQSESGDIVEYDTTKGDYFIKPYLKSLDNLSVVERTELIGKGFSIGRPKGYSFSPEAFLFLLSLQVDLFGLIESGFALDMANAEKDI